MFSVFRASLEKDQYIGSRKSGELRMQYICRSLAESTASFWSSSEVLVNKSSRT